MDPVGWELRPAGWIALAIAAFVVLAIIRMRQTVDAEQPDGRLNLT